MPKVIMAKDEMAKDSMAKVIIAKTFRPNGEFSFFSILSIFEFAILTIRHLTGVKWQDGVSSKKVAKRCSLRNIQERTRQGRLQWFGHVRRKGGRGC